MLSIRLEIGNSTSRITGLAPSQEKALKAILSYDVAPVAASFGGHRSTKRYLLDRRGGFATGLLYLVKKFLAENKITCTVVDTRKVPEAKEGLFTLKLAHEPYPEQLAAALACKKWARGIVSAPTGVGKSVIAALIIHELQVRTLIVVPSLELKRQTTAGLKKAFPQASVGGLGCDIAVENVDALDPCKPLIGYDCVIIDEFHHSGAKTYRQLNKKAWGGIFYRFGTTATPFRSQDNERLLLESVLSQLIYRIPYQTAVDKGYVVPMQAFYYQLPKVPVQGYTWAEVYYELVSGNKRRSRLLANLLDNLHTAKASALCLVKEIQHGIQIAELAEEHHAFVKGENDNNRELLLEFLLNERTTLIGTTGVVGEGVDTKSAEYIIIAGLGKSKNAFMQQVGRGFRVYKGKESCKIILVYDVSHKWTRAHFRAQVKILKDEYGITPVKLPLPDDY
jgi:superfamily II DNA or RNA helicase